jgi:hypothetical protein
MKRNQGNSLVRALGAKPKRMNEPIIGRIWRDAGFKGKPPPVYERKQDEWGFQEGNKVFLRPNVAKGLRNFPVKPRNADAIATLLHEYQHMKQPRVFGGPRIEAAAEKRTIEQLPEVLRRMGYGSVKTPAPVYRNFIQALLARPGSRAFIDRGQFGK